MKTIYIGPSLQGLTTNTIFSGDYPPHVKDLIEKRPALAGLIVGLESLQQSRRDINKQGHILHTNLQKLLKEK